MLDLIITGRVSTVQISEITAICANHKKLVHEYFLERGHPRKEVQWLITNTLNKYSILRNRVKYMYLPIFHKLWRMTQTVPTYVWVIRYDSYRFTLAKWLIFNPIKEMTVSKTLLFNQNYGKVRDPRIEKKAPPVYSPFKRAVCDCPDGRLSVNPWKSCHCENSSDQARRNPDKL